MYFSTYLAMLNTTKGSYPPYNHSSLKIERKSQTGNMIMNHLTHKGEDWPLYVAYVAYDMNSCIYCIWRFLP